MNATRRWAGLAMVATLFLIAGSGLSVFAQAPATGQDAGAAKGPKYTQAEYNAEQACAAEKVPDEMNLSGNLASASPAFRDTPDEGH